MTLHLMATDNLLREYEERLIKCRYLSDVSGVMVTAAIDERFSDNEIGLIELGELVARWKMRHIPGLIPPIGERPKPTLIKED